RRCTGGATVSLYDAGARMGAPGRLHGGVMMAFFDEALGLVCLHLGAETMTAGLTVDFRAPVDVGATLELRAWVERREGRKWCMRGEAYDGDRPRAVDRRPPRKRATTARLKPSAIAAGEARRFSSRPRPWTATPCACASRTAWARTSTSRTSSTTAASSSLSATLGSSAT